MKKSIQTLVFLAICQVVIAQNDITIISWNISDLGVSKNMQEVDSILHYIQQYDLIALQEVVAGNGGVEKVQEIVAQLNAKYHQYDYRVSEPTNSPSSYISERYTYIWRINALALQLEPHLDTVLDSICDREPYIGYFTTLADNRSFDVLSFHARPANKDPQSEITELTTYPSRRHNENVIILGDFNTSEQDKAWKKLYQQHFSVCLVNRPTTLKTSCTEEGVFRLNAYDNIYYYMPDFRLKRKGVVDFVGTCENLGFARGISGHLPVFVEF